VKLVTLKIVTSATSTTLAASSPMHRHGHRHGRYHHHHRIATNISTTTTTTMGVRKLCLHRSMQAAGSISGYPPLGSAIAGTGSAEPLVGFQEARFAIMLAGSAMYTRICLFNVYARCADPFKVIVKEITTNQKT
jgi:hypothetical protein